uniref:Secreted protein n=1 Tax=Meloidogyne javanica TaxID=6303 RepID=A0A915M258_MELJA
MRDKAKMLLLPFNLVWLALILASNFDLGDTASNFDEDGVLKESRIKRLEQIAEIDNSTGMPRGGLYQSDSIKFEEYKYLKEQEEYKTLSETFNKAFVRLVNKIHEFAQLNLKNINISLDKTEEIANELKKYDEIVKHSKNVDELLEGVMIRTEHS